MSTSNAVQFLWNSTEPWAPDGTVETDCDVWSFENGELRRKAMAWDPQSAIKLAQDMTPHRTLVFVTAHIDGDQNDAKHFIESFIELGKALEAATAKPKTVKPVKRSRKAVKQ